MKTATTIMDVILSSLPKPGYSGPRTKNKHEPLPPLSPPPAVPSRQMRRKAERDALKASKRGV